MANTHVHYSHTCSHIGESRVRRSWLELQMVSLVYDHETSLLPVANIQYKLLDILGRRVHWSVGNVIVWISLIMWSANNRFVLLSFLALHASQVQHSRMQYSSFCYCAYNVMLLYLFSLILELKWIETVYDIEQCISWMDHAKQLQTQVCNCSCSSLLLYLTNISTVHRPKW